MTDQCSHQVQREVNGRWTKRLRSIHLVSPQENIVAIILTLNPHHDILISRLRIKNTLNYNAPCLHPILSRPHLRL